MKKNMYYQIITVAKKEIGLVWQFAGDKPRLECIYLPASGGSLREKIIQDRPEVGKAAREIPGNTAGQIAKIYQGENVKFDFSLLNLASPTPAKFPGAKWIHIRLWPLRSALRERPARWAMPWPIIPSLWSFPAIG